MAHIYRPPPAEEVEPDLMLIRRRQARSNHRQRLLDFAARITSHIDGDNRTQGTMEPCACGRNHYAIARGDELFCPLQFWLNVCQLVRMRDGNAAMIAWSLDHPIGRYMVRIDKTEDAVFRKENE